MDDVEFSESRLLEQASGNQSAMYLVSLAWAKQRDGSVDSYALFVGDEFADSWDELRGAGARAVARMAGLNFASSATPGSSGWMATNHGPRRSSRALIPTGSREPR